jgi:hypothetical protein
MHLVPWGFVTAREEGVMAEIYHGVTIPLPDACYRLALGSLEATDYNLDAATALWRQSLLMQNNLDQLDVVLKEILAAVLNTVVWETAGRDESAKE